MPLILFVSEENGLSYNLHQWILGLWIEWENGKIYMYVTPTIEFTLNS